MEDLVRTSGRHLPVGSAVLAAALEHIPGATFLVSARARILAANRIGTEWLAAERANRDLLLGAGGPCASRFKVTLIPAGSSMQYLAVLRSPAVHATLVLERAARWGFTRREAEVVAWILRGVTNRLIASELGCAMKTVEHHVSSILRKANVESRAGLIVAILDA
jgi:DNA-binding NarL/FixJ family response regulator